MVVISYGQQQPKQQAGVLINPFLFSDHARPLPGVWANQRLRLGLKGQSDAGLQAGKLRSERQKGQRSQ